MAEGTMASTDDTNADCQLGDVLCVMGVGSLYER